MTGILYRVAVPLLVAASFVYLGWGQNNIFFCIAVPPVLLVWRMATGDSQDTIKNRAQVRDWYRGHFYEILSFIFLGAFQIAVAAMAEGKVENPLYWLIMILSLFVPYVLLMLVARHSLEPIERDKGHC